jgi:hypothetical protein
MTDGKWQMEDGKRQMADARRQLAARRGSLARTDVMHGVRCANGLGVAGHAAERRRTCSSRHLRRRPARSAGTPCCLASVVSDSFHHCPARVMAPHRSERWWSYHGFVLDRQGRRRLRPRRYTHQVGAACRAEQDRPVRSAGRTYSRSRSPRPWEAEKAVRRQLESCGCAGRAAAGNAGR